ncbi:MAG: hypothetical protein COB41_09100 [Proteobacteria bacterium]|nr:MAG: hypothetical protein COB41_09100 [Pseudomonadota bacterium]
MEFMLSSIDYKDPLWIAVAFLFGALSRALGLPPLVGFLVAGFSLNYAGAQGGEFLNEMADLGITLLLFSIGLKLKIKELLRTEIWGGALAHMLIFSIVSIATLLLLKQMSLPLFEELSFLNMLILSFALSFSSTVFVVKALEERGDFLSQYGQIAIGILIIQDLVAVLYLGISQAKVPSLWAVALVVLIILARPLMIKLSTKVGHGELLLLFGLSMALGGASLFEMVDMKADLGALVFGVLLANTAKADELSKALFGIKELFLVGFFLSIGMAGLPDMTTLLVVAILLILLLIKSGLFLLLLSRFKVKIYPASKASIALGNFSEFGLIVTIVAVSQAWISTDWLVVMALLVAVSFVISSTLNKRFDDLFSRFQTSLQKIQAIEVKEDGAAINFSDVQVLVCGMGRVGSGAYDYLVERQKKVIGLDFDENIVKMQSVNGRETYCANVSSSDFWSFMDIKNTTIECIFLCVSNVEANKEAANLIRQSGFEGKLSAVSLYPDEEKSLMESGVDTVFNIYTEAGAGLAQHSQKFFTIK